MKTLTIAAISMLLSTHTVASTSSSSVFSGNSSPLNALGQAFNNHSTISPKIDPTDMTMGMGGYAGEDVSRNLAISSPTTAL